MMGDMFLTILVVKCKLDELLKEVVIPVPPHYLPSLLHEVGIVVVAEGK